MPILRLIQQRRVTPTPQTGYKDSPEVLVNPLRYRSEIFRAVRVSHKQETVGRYVHYCVRRNLPRLPAETERTYTDSGPRLDINMKISKAGQRYQLEGSITDKGDCTTYSTLCFLKTIPARYNLSNPLSETRLYQALSWMEVRERLIGLQLQLDEIQREQTTLMRYPFSHSGATPIYSHPGATPAYSQTGATPGYHQEPRYQEQSVTPFSPYHYPQEPQNNPSPY